MLGPPDARPFRALTIDWAYGALENEAEAYKSALVVPIDEGGTTTGAIAAYAKASHAFRSDQARALQTLAEEVAPGITNARRFARAEQRAATDELTGAGNRNAYEAELEREVARAGRTGRPLSLLVLDLTREPAALGDVSDQDVALREFAALVTRVTRATDILCRRGPREFAILLPETQAAGARTFLSRLRQEIAGNTFTHGASTMVSAGLVDWRPNETSSALDARVLAAVTHVSGEAAEPATASTGDANENARERVGDPEPETRSRPYRLASRQTFLDRLAHEVGRAHRDDDPLTLLVLDVSDFRAVSEKLGEVGATRVLADVAARLGNGVPGGGLSCRTREDELAVLLPQTTANRAESIFAALQASLHAQPPKGTDRLIVSAGITELTASDDPGSVFGRAEQALWQARQAGEGTVVVATANGDHRG
jgi:diguanylate cyclase (GGDEF)-like protein